MTTDAGSAGITPTWGTRVATIAVTLSTAMGMCLAAAFVVDRTPLDSGSPAFARTLGGTAVLAALLLALAVLSEPATSPAKATSRLVRTAISLQPYAVFAVLAAWAILLRPTDRGLTRFDRVTVLAALWTAFAVACVFVLNRGDDGTGRMRKRGTVISVMPAVLGLCAVLAVLVVRRSAAQVDVVLLPGMLIFAIASVAILPAVSVQGAVKGLDTMRRRGERAVRFARDRPWLIVGCATAKLIAIGVIWLASPVPDASRPVMDTSWPAWVLSGVAATLTLALFAVDKRAGLSAMDQHALSRTAGWLVGSSLGVLVATAFAIGMISNLVQQPLAIVAGAAVLGLGAAVGCLSRRSARGISYLLVVLSAAGLAVLMGTDPVAERAPLADITEPLAWVALGAGLVVGALWILIRRARSPRPADSGHRRWTLLVWAVAACAVVTTGFILWLAPAMTALNVDLALTVMLTAAAVLSAFGVQHEIDGFEIAVTLAVTAVLVDLPLVARLMAYPEWVTTAIAVLAVLGPGTAAIWNAFGTGPDTDSRRSATRGLALVSLLYCLPLTLVWLLPPASVKVVVDTVGTAVFAVLALPLALLLIAGGEWSVRKDDEFSVTRWGRGAPAGARDGARWSPAGGPAEPSAPRRAPR